MNLQTISIVPCLLHDKICILNHLDPKIVNVEWLFVLVGSGASVCWTCLFLIESKEIFNHYVMCMIT